MPREPRGWRERLVRAAPSLLSILSALVLGWVAIALNRGAFSIANDAYLQMLWGGAGDLPRLFDSGDLSALFRPWGETATKAALLTFTGLSVSVAFSVGPFNIGAQGQLMVGAITAAVVGAAFHLPAVLHVPLCLAASAATGAAYGLIPAWLKQRRGVHEVISTIMLNWIATSLIEGWLVAGPLKAISAEGLSRSGTEDIQSTAVLPRLLGDASRLNLGAVLAVAAAALIWLWLSRTRHGFETRAVGLGPEAARASGISLESRTYQAMAIAGALAGLAGAVFILGTERSYPAALGGSLGFDGIAIALIGQNNPAGIAASALFFGLLRAGGTRMQLLGVHKSFPELIQGMALLFMAGKWVWERLLQRLRRPRLDVTVEVSRA